MVKAATAGPQVATANRLGDGAVVFLARNGGWTTDLQAARVASDPDGAQILAAAADEAVRAAHVVGPYLIAVAEEDGRWSPLAFRERIRAAGPSLDLPRPAAPMRE